MIGKYFSLWVMAIRRLGVSLIAMALAIIFTSPAQVQLPLLSRINLETFKLDRNLTDSVISACVRLDGNCVFELSERTKLSRQI